jgi:MYXO-CTERM domain-containing protein
MKAFLSGSIAILVGSAALFVASTSLADGEPCYVDTDCPGTACGDAVCNWTKQSPMPSGTKVFYCNPAGTDAVGMDGWCQTDADCKCKGEGAVCNAPYCSITKAPGGGSGGASSGTGGAPATTAGAPSTSAGAPATTAGAPSTSAGATSTPAPSSDSSGGCSISVPGKTTGRFAAALAMVGLGVAFRRRRR